MHNKRQYLLLCLFVYWEDTIIFSGFLYLVLEMMHDMLNELLAIPHQELIKDLEPVKLHILTT